MRCVVAIVMAVFVCTSCQGAVQGPVENLPGMKVDNGKLNFGVLPRPVPDLGGIDRRLGTLEDVIAKFDALPDKLTNAAWSGGFYGAVVTVLALAGGTAFMMVVARRRE